MVFLLKQAGFYRTFSGAKRGFDRTFSGVRWKLLEGSMAPSWGGRRFQRTVLRLLL